MPFPFLAPLKPWVVDVMELREKNPHMVAYKNPYAVMTSSALVMKGAGSVETDKQKRKKQIIDIINGTTVSNDTYRGCIISNNINNVDLSYSLNKTIVGIDFDGKHIEVIGETGRKISTPIIESIEVDTDGANNTLKTARVAIRCFSLKQLEMFEMFFMKPGMNVAVEWGDASLLKRLLTSPTSSPNSPQTQTNKFDTWRDGKLKNFNEEIYKSPEQALIINSIENNAQSKDKYKSFCENFSKYYRSDTDALLTYLQRIEKSLGTYDLVAGKVLDYSFSVDANGTYNVSVEVSAGNQVSLAIPHSPTVAGSNEKTPPADTEFTSFEQITAQMSSDFNFDKTIFTDLLKRAHPEKGGTWENDCFNFLKINKQQKDTTASDSAYISLRFILGILMNYGIAGSSVDEDFFKLNLPTYKDDKTDVLAIPVMSNIYMISSTEDVIFPTQELPVFEAPNNADKNTKSDTNSIVIAKDKKRNILINGYDFHHLHSKKLIFPVNGLEITAANPSDRIGDALNIFVNYEKVVKAWRSTYTRIEFLEKVLNMINNNSYGLIGLVYGLQHENGKPTVIDAKMQSSKTLKEQEVKSYRFKPGSINSIVKEFSFNFEMSNLVAGRTIFNSGKLIEEANKEKEQQKSQQNNQQQDSTQQQVVQQNNYMELPAAAYKSIDNSTFGNADGWYSINNVELINLGEKFKKAKEAEKDKVNNDPEPKKDDSTSQSQNFLDIINNKSVKFIMSKGANPKIESLVFQDTKLIQNAITGIQNEEGDKKSVLSPIDITIGIDGFSGFSCGQYFNVDGVPEIYNKLGAFQITNIKHAVATDGWKTTIEASFRIINKKDEKKSNTQNK